MWVQCLFMVLLYNIGNGQTFIMHTKINEKINNYTTNFSIQKCERWKRSPSKWHLYKIPACVIKLNHFYFQLITSSFIKVEIQCKMLINKHEKQFLHFLQLTDFIEKSRIHVNRIIISAHFLSKNRYFWI